MKRFYVDPPNTLYAVVYDEFDEILADDSKAHKSNDVFCLCSNSEDAQHIASLLNQKAAELVDGIQFEEVIP
jgi:hypothetical protein